MRPIDVHHLGRERVICCWQVGDVLVDPGPESSIEAVLEALGDDVPRALLLTHIHLDHAGASGTLTRRWPHLEVYVHERGAPHMVDPEKLLASARRLYGDDMDRLWGRFEPVPEENVRVLRGGEIVGDFRVEYTPGHASHHVCYLHEPTRVAFAGDVAGVRIPPADHVLAPTPPPDIDVEAWLASIDILEGWSPNALAITHFGRVDAVEAQLAAVREALALETQLARAHDEAGFIAALGEAIERDADPDTAAVYRQAAPFAQLYAGLERYLRKQVERA